MHAGDVGFSERVTSLKEIPFNQKKICDPPGHVSSRLSCFQGMLDGAFLPKTEEGSGSDRRFHHFRLVVGHTCNQEPVFTCALVLQAGSELNTNNDQILGH